MPKAGSRIGLPSLLLLAGAGSVHDATALNETRTLSFHHTHSDEDLTVTFKRDGRYDEDALKQLNHFLRDWRSQDETMMDRHLFDILWEVYRDVDGKQPIQIISSYRSPATNAMLRRRSSGVARFSQHMLGHAMDFYIPDVPLEQIRFAGLRLQRGGVGFYPTSGSPFVHLDTGSIRHWPRMTHDQLARVFPDGRTVHVPTDGTPLKGYELAKADIERRGSGDDCRQQAELLCRSVQGQVGSGRTSSDEDDEARPPRPRSLRADRGRRRGQSRPIRCRRRAPSRRSPLRSSSLRPMRSSLRRPSRSPRPWLTSRQPASRRPRPTSSMPAASGMTPATPQQATPAQVAALKARQALAAATDPQADRERLQRGLSGAGLCAGVRLPGRPRQRRRRLRADPAHTRPVADAHAAPATEINTVVGKSSTAVIATATRLSAARGKSIWLEIVMLSPSASRAMSVTLMGEPT